MKKKGIISLSLVSEQIRPIQEGSSFLPLVFIIVQHICFGSLVRALQRFD